MTRNVAWHSLVVSLFFLSLISIAAVKDSHATTHPDDIEALQRIKGAVAVSTIPPSACLDSWNFADADPCDTASSADLFVCGLECGDGYEHRRVTTLTLDSPGYGGTLSPFIGNLSALQVLHLSNNNFFGEIPETVGRLKNLIDLDLSGNLLSGVLPSSLGQLASLQSLMVSNNMLEGSIPTTINHMTNLTRIYVFSNHLSGRIPAMDSLSQLAFFDASSNKLSGPLPSRLPASLLLLSLKNNSLTGRLLPSFVSITPRLNVLDVSENHLSGEVDATLFTLPSLEQVNLSSNHFIDFTAVNISGLRSNLVALDLSFNELGGSLPSFVGDMPRLASLSLRHNQFTGDIPYEYGMMSADDSGSSGQLARLWLDGNFLRGQVPASFLNLSSDSLVGSFIDNCFQNCPSALSFCRGGDQKSRRVCENAYSKE